jgi:hypothetical protein
MCPKAALLRKNVALAASLLALGFVIAAARPCWAQGARPRAGRADSELLIPDSGPLRRGQGQRVVVKDRSGAERIGLLHAEVGDRRLIILPDGRLESVPSASAPVTDKAFVPATKDEIAAGLKDKGFHDFKVRATARYVYVYNTSEEFRTSASRILETMYPAVLAYFKRLKLPVHHPEMPLVAIMFRTEEEFQKYDPVPDSIAAYYNTVTNQIVMYEQSDLVNVAPELAIKQSIGVIAHEGIHQILHNIGVQQRLSRWPIWLAEGLAEYFAPTEVGRRMRWKGVGRPHDLRMFELNRVMQQGEDAQGEIVEQVVAAERLSSSGYAAAWSLVHYLASRQRDKFHAYLRDVAQLGPLEPRGRGGDRELENLFARHFGTNYAAMEKELVGHLRSLPYVDPIANQTHYVVMIDSAALRAASVTTSPGGARQWQEQTLTKLPPTVRASTRFQILPFESKAQAESYAQQFLGGGN